MGLALGVLLALPIGAEEEWIDFKKLEPSVYIQMAYATPNNFLKETVYPKETCLLRRPVALALQKAQQDLLTQGYSLKIWDCYRPLSVQKKMWALVPDDRYVADPKTGSRHNRGAAVDITLVTKNGSALEVPTDFDDFSPIASPSAQNQWSDPARKHVQILQKALNQVGFKVLASEWWHYDYQDWQQYSVSDFPLP